MTSMATTSQPASSAAWASAGPLTSSAWRRDTEVEMVSTTARKAPRAYSGIELELHVDARRGLGRRRGVVGRGRGGHRLRVDAGGEVVVLARHQRAGVRERLAARRVLDPAVDRHLEALQVVGRVVLQAPGGALCRLQRGGDLEGRRFGHL